MITEVTIVSHLVGTFFWPSEVEWIKPVRVTFSVTSDDVHTTDQISSLREGVERICSDGDSQAAPLLSPDGYVELTRHSATGHRTVIRRFRLASFRSVADYLSDEPVSDPSEDEVLEAAEIAMRIDDELADLREAGGSSDVDPVGRRLALSVFAEVRRERAEEGEPS